MNDVVLMIHLVSTLVMTGVIWVIQLVHYPLFQLVGREEFAAYERSHQVRISFIVIPAMFTELGAAAGLAIVLPGDRQAWALIGLALLGVIWLSTFFIQVPCHDRLARGFDEAAWRRLVRSNWLRTIAWTVRTGVAVALLR